MWLSLRYLVNSLLAQTGEATGSQPPESPGLGRIGRWPP